MLGSAAGYVLKASSAWQLQKALPKLRFPPKEESFTYPALEVWLAGVRYANHRNTHDLGWTQLTALVDSQRIQVSAQSRTYPPTISRLKMDLPTVAKYVAVPSSFLLGSYNFVFSQNVIPHMYSFPAATSTPMFAKIFGIGSSTIAPMAASAILAYSFLSYNNPSKRTIYASSAVLTVSTLVLTVVAMKPGISRLIEISKSNVSSTAVDGEARQLLKAWVGQNYFRSSLHVAAGLLGFYAILN